MTEPGQRKHKPGKRHCDERINWPAVCKTGLLTGRQTCYQNDRLAIKTTDTENNNNNCYCYLLDDIVLLFIAYI